MEGRPDGPDPRRGGLRLNWDRRQGLMHRAIFTPMVLPPPPPRPVSPALRVTPIGRALEVASDRTPSTLHLMSLVATDTEALITVVMRMHRPPDESSSDPEITEAGPQHRRASARPALPPWSQRWWPA